jgi:hypothetical protein
MDGKGSAGLEAEHPNKAFRIQVEHSESKDKAIDQVDVEIGIKGENFMESDIFE